jgi:hypothetical protein
LVTTDRKLNASWIVRHYEERPEIEQDYGTRPQGSLHRLRRHDGVDF